MSTPVSTVEILTAEDISAELTPGTFAHAAVSLLEAGSNIRHELPAIEMLTASVAQVGVEQPLWVSVGLGCLEVIDGHRRLEAAKRAGVTVVPVIIKAPMVGADRNLAQFRANETGERLTVMERAEQIALFADAGIKRKDLMSAGVGMVETARAKAVAGCEDKERLAALAGRVPALRLDVLAEIAELADNEHCHESVASITEQIEDDPARVAHILEWARRRARANEEAAPLIAEWRAKGYEVRGPGDDHPVGWQLFRCLYTDSGKPLSEEEHASCPHRAVKIIKNWRDTGKKWIVEHWCTDPSAHRDAVSVNEERRSQRAAEREKEEQAAAKRREAADAAQAVRDRWIAGLLKDVVLPKGAMAWAVTILGGSTPSGRRFVPFAEVCRVWARVEELLGADVVARWAKRGCKADRMLVACGYVVVDEMVLPSLCAAKPNDMVAEILTQLAQWGYALSEIEQAAVDLHAETGDAKTGDAEAGVVAS